MCRNILNIQILERLRYTEMLNLIKCHHIRVRNFGFIVYLRNIAYELECYKRQFSFYNIAN